MNWMRASGILLHPTSLPGRYGIGDLGNAAYRWIDFLVASHQKLWQVLPLGPTGYADSPYACLSAFAGNPLLISLDQLQQAGDLTAKELADVPDFPAGEVDADLQQVDLREVVPGPLDSRHIAVAHHTIGSEHIA